jgi:hypothetical protein
MLVIFVKKMSFFVLAKRSSQWPDETFHQVSVTYASSKID